MKPNLQLAVCIILIIWLLPVTAKTYRWVDENGVTIYSQNPPPSGNATVIKPPPKPAADPEAIMESLKRRQEAIDEAKKMKKASASEQLEMTKNKKIMEENCNISKKNLERIQQHGRVKMKQEDGSYKALTDEDKKAKIEQYNKDIKEWCK